MRKERKMIIVYIVIMIVSLIASISLQYFNIQKNIEVLGGYTDFSISLGISIFSSAFLGVIISIVNYKNKKENHIIYIIEITLDIYHYLSNFKDLQDTTDKDLAMLQLEKSCIWLNSIMNNCGKYKTANDLMTYKCKKEGKVLDKLTSLIKEVYRECNCLNDQLSLIKNEKSAEEINKAFMGQKEYILDNRKYIDKIKQIIKELCKVYNVKLGE